MQSEKVRQQMMSLWQETFHDSDEYVRLVFDNYYDENLVAYKCVNGTVVSALLGVPYNFQRGDTKATPLHGLYLCGLATTDSFRNKGYMSELIEQINDKAALQNFDFTFLIPANDGLKKYYKDRKYFDSFYNTNLRYSSVHNFRNEFVKSHPDKVALFDSFVVNKFEDSCGDLFDEVYNLISTCEVSNQYFSIQHTAKDFSIVCKENMLNGRGVFVASSDNCKIVGVAICVDGDEDNMKVQRLYCKDEVVKYKLLDFVKSCYPDKGLVIEASAWDALKTYKGKVYNQYHVLYDKDYDAQGLVVADDRIAKFGMFCKSYAMIRPLNLKKIVNSCCILKDKNITYPFVNGSMESSEEAIFAGFRVSAEENVIFRKPDPESELDEVLNLPIFAVSSALLLE